MRIQLFALFAACLPLTAANAQSVAPSHAAPGAAPAAPATAPSAFVVKFRVKPGSNAAFEQVFREMQQGVREHEPGNLYYDLYRSAQDAQTYYILEHYRDQAAVTAHGRSEHAKKMITALRDLLDGPPDAQRLILVSSK